MSSGRQFICGLLFIYYTIFSKICQVNEFLCEIFFMTYIYRGCPLYAGIARFFRAISLRLANKRYLISLLITSLLHIPTVGLMIINQPMLIP